MRQITTDQGEIALNDLPSSCPHCHHSIIPHPLFGHYIPNEQKVEVFLYCPNENCNKAFIADYANSRVGLYFDGNTSIGTLVGKEFSETIGNLSSGFISIFTESYIAEQQNLTEICGVGYRKALEFLIKDYSIKSHPDKKEVIEKKLLGQCIKEYVVDSRIQSVAKRAAWLGNDETHYVRKWEGKNLSDLKKLIELTVHWIEMEALTESFEEDMPE